MGELEQFAKRTFAEEVERITDGAAVWVDPPEVRLGPMQGDGFLVVRAGRADTLAALPHPWPAALAADETLVELKMPADHLDLPAVERALLRRQGRRVQRVEAAAEEEAPWPPQEPLWIVAPHLPAWLREHYEVTLVAPGCYRIGPAQFPFLWIAANGLPLHDALVPFLVARSGRALHDFIRWVAPRRLSGWVHSMLSSLPMSDPIRREVLEKLAQTTDPAFAANQLDLLQIMLNARPDWKEQLLEEDVQKNIHLGRLTEARAFLRRVLDRRGLVVSPEQDARIEECQELATLARWHDQAVTAGSTDEALM